MGSPSTTLTNMGSVEKSTKCITMAVTEWIKSCEKSLEVVYGQKPGELSISEALQGNPSLKICDPYGYMSEMPLCKKVKSVENEDGKSVAGELRNISGNLLVKLTTGEELSGRWVDGKREGLGALTSPRLDKVGVESIAGIYQDGIIAGKGKVFMKDKSVREGWFQHGYFHGPARGIHADGELNYIGHYKAGLPIGMTWVSVKGGGWIVGCVDSQGNHSGPEIAFLYPDLTTALFGEFKNGMLVHAKEARISNIETCDRILSPSFQVVSEREFCFWPSTADDICCPPLQDDPYERSLLRVGASRIAGGGEGLYAKKEIAAGRVVAYYNGIRMKAGENSPYDEDTGYAIFVEWHKGSKDVYKKGDHMDLPPQYQSSTAYRASLAHKLNHSFTPNCCWTNADHPCFCFVPSVSTMEGVKEGEELTIHYSIDMENAPEWYLECWDNHSNILLNCAKTEEDRKSAIPYCQKLLNDYFNGMCD